MYRSSGESCLVQRGRIYKLTTTVTTYPSVYTIDRYIFTWTAAVAIHRTILLCLLCCKLLYKNNLINVTKNGFLQDTVPALNFSMLGAGHNSDEQRTVGT